MASQKLSHKSSSPFRVAAAKLALTRTYKADHLKVKAEELVMKRMQNELRKNTDDCHLVKLNLEQEDCNFESDENNSHNLSVKKIKRPHKESFAKPLFNEEDDESPLNKRLSSKWGNDCKFNDNISRLMDEKRSTIKEQIEDEEEFTGSSQNFGDNLHKITLNILNKRDSKPSRGSQKEGSEENNRISLRKFSDQLFSNEKCEAIKVIEKKQRKLTENIDDTYFFKSNKKVYDNDVTTQEGTSVITPAMGSRRESGFEGYTASITSTPVLMSRLKYQGDDSPAKINGNNMISQLTILRT